MSRMLILVDVDGTLIARTRSGLRPRYNIPLIVALQKANITDIYLFTDMVFTQETVVERLALIQFLNQHNINVLGVVTPNDYLWDLPDETLTQFATEYREQYKEVLPYNIPEDDSARAIRARLLKHYNESDWPHVEPGAAFDDVKQGEINDELLIKSKHCKVLFDLIAKNAKHERYDKYSHPKGKLFDYVLMRHRDYMSSIMIFDDCDEVLNSVERSAREKSRDCHSIKVRFGQNYNDEAYYFDAILSAQYHARICALHQLLRDEKLQHLEFCGVIITDAIEKMVGNHKTRSIEKIQQGIRYLDLTIDLLTQYQALIQSNTSGQDIRERRERFNKKHAEYFQAMLEAPGKQKQGWTRVAEVLLACSLLMIVLSLALFAVILGNATHLQVIFLGVNHLFQKLHISATTACIATSSASACTSVTSYGVFRSAKRKHVSKAMDTCADVVSQHPTEVRL